MAPMQVGSLERQRLGWPVLKMGPGATPAVNHVPSCGAPPTEIHGDPQWPLHTPGGFSHPSPSPPLALARVVHFLLSSLRRYVRVRLPLLLIL